MGISTTMDLFEKDLQDIYFAEKQLVKALDTMKKESKTPDLKDAFSSHKTETQKQVKRLEKVFKSAGLKVKAKNCPGIMGLIKEKKEMTTTEKPTDNIKDMINVTSAKKVERYEITAYEGLIDLASKNDMDDAVELLQANLEEEIAALEKMQSLAQGF